MNKIEIMISARTENIMICRATITAFMLTIDSSEAELNEVKTLVSEAITNAIIHGYEKDHSRDVRLLIAYESDELYIEVEDFGKGIIDIEKAKEALYTTKTDDERSGLGFTIIDMFSDYYEVESNIDKGTIIKCFKKIGHAKEVA